MLNIRKGIKKLISYVMVFVLTVMVVGSAAVILSGISVYAWFDGSGYEGIYIFGSKPLTDYVNISNMTDDNMLPHANEAGYTKVSATQKIYRLTRTSTNGRCSRCGAGMISYKSYWGVIADDGTIYVYDIHDCSHCGNCSFGYSVCYYGHENELEDEGKTITFTAWVPNKYTITFNPNNGGNTFTGTAVYGTGDCNVASSYNPTLDGYSFGGWYTGADGTGEQVYDKDGKAVNGTYWSGNGSTAVWKGTTNISVYAYWIAANTDVTLYFYKDGVKDDSKTKTYSVKNGSTFNATDHAADSTFDNCHYVSIDCTSWTVPGEVNSANVYYESDVLKISYIGNGNTGGSTSETTAKYGNRMTVANNGFIKTGYSFNGWNTKSDGTGTSYAAGSQFDAQPSYNGETITVYAQWNPNSYNVKLDKGTGISSVSGAGSYAYGTEVSIDATPGTGYSWSRWTGSAEITAKNYKFNIGAGDMAFTANATPDSYRVTFDANGGSCVNSQGQTVQSVTVTYDSGSYNDISGLVSASRNGYKFAGWKGGQSSIWDDKGLAVNGDYWSGKGNSAKWRYAGNAVASAEWVDISPPTVSASPDSTMDYVTSLNVTITAADNEALAGDSAYEYCLGTDSNSPAAGAAWTGYTSGSAFTIGSGLSGTYYLWVRHVRDTAGNYSVSNPNVDYHRFGPYYFDSTAPDLSGVSSSYGWYSEGTTITFNISDAHAGIAGAVLTDFNGVPIDNGDITVSRQFYFASEGAAFYCLTVTDRLGNTARKLFNVKIDQKGEVIPDNAVWKGLSSITLFAHWNPNSYKIHFEKNDNDSGSTRATGSMVDATFTYDESRALPANGFSRVGYTFAGWNRSADGTADNDSNYKDKEVVKNLTLTPNGIVNLYAQWASNEYTLTFDYNKPAVSTGVLTSAGEKSRRVWFDKSIGQLPEPEIAGWEFAGWYVDNVKISAGDIWHYTINKTAVAKWTAVKYEVRLHSNVPIDALGSLGKLNPSGWTWNGNEYYSAVFTYDTLSNVPNPKDVYSLTEYNISGWYSNAMAMNYVGYGSKIWNLLGASGVVDLYPMWKDTTGPRVTVTPAKTTNPNADNNAMRKLTVNIKIEESGSGLASNNNYEFGFSTSRSSQPAVWQKYSTTTQVTGFNVTLPDLGSTLDGYYYLWVKQIQDRSGNKSQSSGALATVAAGHVFGVYAFDNTAPTGTAKYVENNAMLGLYDSSANPNPYAVISVNDARDEIAGVKKLTLVIADASNLSNRVEYPLTGSGSKYSVNFNLYNSLSNYGDIAQVNMYVIAEDKVGNKRTLPITTYDFGTKQDGTPIKGDDIGYSEVVDTTSDNDGDGDTADTDDDIHYIRDAFRVEAAVHDATGDRRFARGQLGFVDVYTFGNVETIAIDFGSLCNYVNTLNGVSLPTYTWDINPNLRTTTVNHGETGLYRHEFYIPLYAAESTYTDTLVTGTKKGRQQYRSLTYDVNGTVLDDIKTILKYGED